MLKPSYILKLSIVGACAALALGYGGALTLDAIGLTAVREAAAQGSDAPPLVRYSETTPARIRIDESRDRAPSQAATASQEPELVEASPERPGSVRTGALEPPLSTGSLGDRRPESKDAAPNDAPLPSVSPENAAPAAPEEETELEPMNLGAGLARVGALEMPPPAEPAPAPLSPARVEPSPLQNVELLEPRPAPKTLRLPEEPVIQIGPRNKGALPATAAAPAGETYAPAPEDAKPAQKPRKSAKAKKRKKDGSFAQGMQDTLSAFGF